MIFDALCITFIFSWLGILSLLGRYFGHWLVFQWTLYRHPEDGVCCCGSHIDDHSIWDNHAIKTEREWYIECNTPKFK